MVNFYIYYNIYIYKIVVNLNSIPVLTGTEIYSFTSQTGTASNMRLTPLFCTQTSLKSWLLESCIVAHIAVYVNLL